MQLRVLASLCVDITDLVESDAGAAPWLIQRNAGQRQQVFESCVVLAHDRLDEQQRHVCARFLDAERRYAERDLNELLEVIPRVWQWAGCQRKVGKMLSHSVFDHSLVGADDEGRLRDKEEEANRFERVDRGDRQAPVKVVDQDDELVDLASSKSFANSSLR
jgi:hypothetical protein